MMDAGNFAPNPNGGKIVSDELFEVLGDLSDTEDVLIEIGVKSGHLFVLMRDGGAKQCCLFPVYTCS
jgi:hypothetical protein